MFWEKFFKTKVVSMVVVALLTLCCSFFFSGKLSVVNAASDYIALSLNDKFVDGNIGEKGEADFYNLTIPTAGWLTITYQGWNIKDAHYAVLSEDTSKTFVSHEIYYSSDTDPKTSSSKLALEAGNYIVKVWGHGDNTGDFKIKGSFVSAGNNETEPNDYFSSSMDLPKDKLVTGFLSRQDRLDFYKIDVTSSMTMDIILTSRTNEIYCSIWNNDFVKVEEIDVYYASETSPVTKTMNVNLTPGTYYIKCIPNGDDTGRYQIKWEVAPTLITALQITGNGKVSAEKSLQLSASIMPTTASNKNLVWSSSNTDVATVDSNTGKVYTKYTGYTTITVESQDGSKAKASVNVIVSPKKMSAPKVKAKGKKRVTISWKKQNNVNSYQIRYSKKKNFKGSKTLNFNSYNNKVNARLKKKGNLYFQIRAISYVDGNNLYGEWSNSKRVKVK